MAQFEAREIGDRITEARKIRGMTQEELAEIAPFSKRSLQDYEAGATIPYRHLRDLSRLLNKPEEWFLYGDQQAGEPAVAELAVLAQLDRIEQALEVLAARLDLGEQEDQAEAQPD